MTLSVSDSSRDRDAVKRDEPTRGRRRMTAALAVTGAVVIAGSLAGCRGPSTADAPAPSTSSSAPSTGKQGPAGQGPYRVTATVPVGKAPNGVAVGLDKTVYVVNSDDGTLSVIDGPTRTVTATVPVGGNLVGISTDGASVYVVNGTDNTMSVIDAETRAVTATVPVGNGAAGVTVDARTHTVYVTNRDDGTMSVIERRQ